MCQAVFFIHTDQLAEHGRYGSTKDELEATEVVLGTRKHNGGAPKHLLEVIARTTACSQIAARTSGLTHRRLPSANDKCLATARSSWAA